MRCPRCGNTSGAGVAFCQHCGTRLLGEALPASMPCGACGTFNPTGTNYCQGCGARLPEAPEPAPASAQLSSAVPQTDQHSPAVVPRGEMMVGSGLMGHGVVRSLDASPELPPLALAPTPLSPVRPGRPTGALGAVSEAPAAAVRTPAAHARTRLVVVRRDGTDGAVHPLVAEQMDVGRTEGDLLFDDPHLSRRHARLLLRAGEYLLMPLETRNGVYIRLVAPVDLSDGDHVLVGKQVLKFEAVPEAEKNLRPALEHGVVLFGTPVKPPWGRLRQLTSAGTTRDVYHLCRAEVVLGREQGDLVFSDDEFLSRRHAQLSLRGTRPRLEDLGSSNGTFIRLRGPHPLAPGDQIRLGDELLRFDQG